MWGWGGRGTGEEEELVGSKGSEKLVATAVPCIPLTTQGTAGHVCSFGLLQLTPELSHWELPNSKCCL